MDLAKATTVLLSTIAICGTLALLASILDDPTLGGSVNVLSDASQWGWIENTVNYQ